ncbi:hypothetical protein K431DRAFT_20433 [Polychaeton citri CBS 116435]|uniref:Uncharacterized protein n=1 Tax=Polychaeton citri CBS 116435 TaxID=1314669 RepID=A0A9P4Q1F5_9PEZI|nr:hypothetical protein K431DRAFT_20433 [Polychaeton citri CBS 116435]
MGYGLWVAAQQKQRYTRDVGVSGWLRPSGETGAGRGTGAVAPGYLDTWIPGYLGVHRTVRYGTVQQVPSYGTLCTSRMHARTHARAHAHTLIRASSTAAPNPMPTPMPVPMPFAHTYTQAPLQALGLPNPSDAGRYSIYMRYLRSPVLVCIRTLGGRTCGRHTCGAHFFLSFFSFFFFLEFPPFAHLQPVDAHYHHRYCSLGLSCLH